MIYRLAWSMLRIVPLHNGKDDKCECSNLRGINLLSVVGKLYDRGLIKRVRAGTECAVGEEQCGFRHCRGCKIQVFAIRQVCENYLPNGKLCISGFGRAYDTIDQHCMWQMHECKMLEENC